MKHGGQLAKKSGFIGAGVGLALFALLGLIEGSLIGGGIGLGIVNYMFHAPEELTLLSRGIVGVSMLAGVILSGIVFVVICSAAGYMLGRLAEGLFSSMEEGGMLSTVLSSQVRADVVSRLKSGSKTYYFFTAFFGLMLLSAVATGLHARLIGYDKAYNTYREVPWGILISTYVFFVVTSTGLCLVSSIGHVFGKKEFMPMAKRAVYLSILTICAGFLVLAFEIENPVRMAIYNVLSPNMTSNIWWMGTLYGAYLFFMALEFTFILLSKFKQATFFGLLGVVSGIAAHSNLGAVFGMLHGREYWYGPLMPIYFIASAMMSGCAAIILFTWLAYKLDKKEMDGPMKESMAVTNKLAILMIFVVLFFTVWKLIAGSVATPNETAALGAIMSGPYKFNFWVIEVACGMVIPLTLFLTAKGRDLNLMFVASAMMIFGIFFMRLDLVVVGQIVPVYYELGVKDYSHLLSYTPSPHEIMIVLGGIGFVGFNFLLGEKIFDGHKVEHH